jgi:aromatic ring-cleaving dioxygenase
VTDVERALRAGQFRKKEYLSMSEIDPTRRSGDFTPDMAVQPLDAIRSYHAHIYFEGPQQRGIAEILREEIAQRFSVVIGRWHELPIGPHARPMYQVAFSTSEFARVVPWLMINQRGLAVLIHPNTGRPLRDHLSNAIWLGEKLGINSVVFTAEYRSAPEPAIAPTTHPTITP